MTINKTPINDEDELRPEYNLRKLQFVGRGIYAERFRRGTNLDQLAKRDSSADQKESGDEDVRSEYDFRKMRIVKSSPARKAPTTNIGGVQKTSPMRTEDSARILLDASRAARRMC